MKPDMAILTHIKVVIKVPDGGDALSLFGKLGLGPDGLENFLVLEDPL
jgi:hypothetical protein